MLFLNMTRSNSSVRISKTSWVRSDKGEARIPLSVYNSTASRWTTLPKPSGYSSSPNHQCHPVTYHCINQHIENGGGEWFSLSDPVVAFERGAVILPCLGHHGGMLPVVMEEALPPWSYLVYDKDFHEALSVEVITCFN